MIEQGQSGSGAFGMVGRLVVAGYIGALLAGPSPFGFGSSVFEAANSRAIELTAVSAVMIIPWMIVGLVAGRRLDIYAALAGLLFWEWHFLAGGMAALILMAIPVPLVSAWLGSWLSSRLKVARSLDGWRHWRTAGILVLVLAIYTSTVGSMIAGHTMKARFEKMWPADSSTIQTYPAGAYVGADGVSEVPGCVPDTCYMDPSGLVFLYKTNLD
jgi:hypothetical protein